MATPTRRITWMCRMVCNKEQKRKRIIGNLCSSYLCGSGRKKIG